MFRKKNENDMFKSASKHIHSVYISDVSIIMDPKKSALTKFDRKTLKVDKSKPSKWCE